MDAREIQGETLREIEYVERNCDCCGGVRLDEILKYDTKARTRSRTYLWKVRNVVCETCGFAFVSPVPTEESLSEYYADCYSFWRGEAIEFSVENRLALLRRNIRPGSRPLFVEIGSNATEPFQQALAEYVGEYRCAELNNDCDSDFESLQSLAPASVDILSAYFVLEHVTNPGEFLAQAARALKEQGLLVVEVPNLYIYPVNPAGIVWYEHTNHFSPRTLSAIAGAEGFELVEVSYQDCSRPYGFAAVFSKTDGPRREAQAADESEYKIAKACMTEGANLIKNYYAQLDEVRGRIREAARGESPIVLWAANKYCVDLLDGMELPETAIIVDSDPGKKDYLHPLPVSLPGEARDSIRRAGLFVINTSLHAGEILGQIRNEFGRRLSDEEVLIIEPGFQILKSASGRKEAAVPVS
ncbi:MAG TPA: methyltransferase domain-containing protein [Pyrinomonadaceae bacterium]|nr:methyltransferase domain-containing protein [Pyrinomonadaceae bacterium]